MRMSNGLIRNSISMQSVIFPSEWVTATLVLALISAWVVIGLTTYLNRSTGKGYLLLWTAAWMFYSVFLAASLAPAVSIDAKALVVARPACLGISALFLFWGSSQLTHTAVRRSLAWSAVVAVVVWSYLAADKLSGSRWNAVPVFLFLATASAYSGFLYLRRRKHNRGAKILGAGFVLWAVVLIGLPYLAFSPAFLAAGQFGSAIVTLLIGVGMMVEQEVSVSEQKFRALFDSASDAIFLVDLWTLQVVDANQAAQQLTQRSASDLPGASILDLCPDLRKERDNLLDHRKMFSAVFKPYSEFHFARSDGTLILCEGDANMVHWQRQPALQIKVHEVDKGKKIGQIMRRAEKLSSLGQLIAGVAHELNNPLAVVVGYAQILAKQSFAEDKMTASIRNILHESERAAKIVRDLLSFARPIEPQLAAVDINRLVSNVVDVRERELRTNKIQLEKNLAPNLPHTKADQIQIEQVLTNLITNAIHALSGRPSARQLTVTTQERGFFIRITVADTGPGIPPEIQSKIFDPFFTTKTRGRGTGLGLTISNSIVEEHRGKIWTQSEPGKGATFIVELPIVPCEEETGAVKPVTSGTQVDPDAAQHRLLIVDDEPGIVEVLKEVLSSNGYSVETAFNGAEAMQRIETSRFDLIISDLCMPQMDGQKLYRTVLETNADLAKRIIFVTGDTVSPNSREFLESTGNRWFSKPFNITEVEEIVSNCLRQGATTVAAGNGQQLN